MINIFFSIKQLQVMKGSKFCFLKCELCIKISFTVDKVNLRSLLYCKLYFYPSSTVTYKL